MPACVDELYVYVGAVAIMWIVELNAMVADRTTPAESYVLFIKCMIVTFGGTASEIGGWIEIVG